jgi:hypothetical protein
MGSADPPMHAGRLSKRPAVKEKEAAAGERGDLYEAQARGCWGEEESETWGGERADSVRGIRVIRGMAA